MLYDSGAAGWLPPPHFIRTESEAMANRWSNEELEILRREYPKLGLAKSVALLKRTSSSIRWKASKLKLRGPHGNKYEKHVELFSATSPSRTDRAWVASQLDGEGTIGIARNLSRGIGKDISILLNWNSTDFHTIERVQQILREGIIYIREPYGKSIRRIFTLRVLKDRARTVLLRLLPYLVTKERQARLLIRYLDLENIISREEKEEFRLAATRLNGPRKTITRTKRKR